MNKTLADRDQTNVFDEAMSFGERTLAVSLFPAEQRIVSELLAVPHYEIGIMTSADLSQLSGASRSSIDRLSRKLGYPGLKEMRKALLLQGAERSLANNPASGETCSQIAERVMLAIAARAQATARSAVADNSIEILVERLLRARNITLLGAGESAAVCQSIYLRLVRLGLPVHYSDEHHTQVTLASLMQPGDVALVISFSGNTHSTLWAARTAKQNGASIAAICGTPSSALNRMADMRIPLPSVSGLPGSAEVLDRIIAAGLAEVLFQCVAAKEPERLTSTVKIDDTFAVDRP